MLAAVAGLVLGAGSAAAQGPPPIFTKNAALRLPVQLDERSRAEVAEVKLFVRGPAGRWECVQTAPSTQTAFDFRAPTDGEYRFTFVTVDRRGQRQPGQRRSLPRRTASWWSTPPPRCGRPADPVRGEKALQCQVRDANPDWTSLQVSYLAADNTWQPLAAASAGHAERVPGARARACSEGKIQVTAADRAGNRTTREIDLGDPTAPLAMPKGRRGKGASPTRPCSRRTTRSSPMVPDRTVRRGRPSADLPKAPKADLPDMPPLPDDPEAEGPAVTSG